MADLIDRQAAIDTVRSYMADNWIEDSDWHANGIAYEIKRLPTAEPKTGRWEKMEARGRVYRCNQCGNFLDFDGVNVGRGDANFCPNCGARMEGEERGTKRGGDRQRRPPPVDGLV